MRELDSGIWTLEGQAIRFVTFPYELRSTIIDLGGGSLFVHSPVQLAAAGGALEALGRIENIVSPNTLHHLFLAEWAAAFPEAKLHAPPGLRSKRHDLRFDTDLGDQPPADWKGILDQRIVRGSFFMEEVVFFHRAYSTLILGDLIENHDPRGLGPIHRALARANGMLAPNGTTPRNFRLSFWRRSLARKAILDILSWQPRRVILMHGPCIEENALEFLRHAFRWLL